MSPFTSRFRKRTKVSTDRTEIIGNSKEPLPEEVVAMIADDPRFCVTTTVGDIWFDPYTGEALPCVRGAPATAYDHLQQHGHFRGQSPMNLGLLRRVRWLYELPGLVQSDPRFQFFDPSDGHWINPYTGQVEFAIQRESGHDIDEHMVEGMARVLADCPEADGSLLSEEDLDPSVLNLGFGPGSSTQSVSLEVASDAGMVQRHQLGQLPRLEGYQIAVGYRPHEEVGGDFYDIIPLSDEKHLVILGDVSGHGVQAALHVAGAIKLLRLLARQEHDLKRLIFAFNNEMRQDLLPGQFITLFAGILDTRTHRLALVLAGHHQPFIVDLHGPIHMRSLGRPGIAIGLVSGERFAESLVIDVVDLQPGQILVQYSDALVEAGGAGNEFGQQGLMGAILAETSSEVQSMVDGITRRVLKHCVGDADDDLTVLAIRDERPL